MRNKKNQDTSSKKSYGRPAPRLNWRQGGWALACVAAALMLAGAAQPRQQQDPAASPGNKNALPQSNRPAAAATQPKAPDEKAPPASNDAPGADNSRQNAEDGARLLKLATDLKAEVDKTTKDTLSLTVIRKAEEIERLAHSVRERTNQEAMRAK